MDPGASYWAILGAAIITGAGSFFAIVYSKRHDSKSRTDVETSKARAAVFTQYNELLKGMTERITALNTDIISAWDEIRKLRKENNDCHGQLAGLQTQVYFLRDRLGILPTEHPQVIDNKPDRD